MVRMGNKTAVGASVICVHFWRYMITLFSPEVMLRSDQSDFFTLVHCQQLDHARPTKPVAADQLSLFKPGEQVMPSFYCQLPPHSGCMGSKTIHSTIDAPPGVPGV